MRLTDRHVLITGGSAGIGLALARAALGDGARVTICGRRADRLESAIEALGGDVQATTCDVGDAEQHRSLLDAAERAHGPIDVLINNAGVQQLMDFTRRDQTRAIAREIGINLTGAILLTEAALPGLLDRPSAAVVQITSGLALVPKQSAPVYCATKAGLRHFTRALRWQLADTMVQVMEVLPPLVATEMTAGRGAGKIGPERVARDTLAGLRRGATEVYVGKTKLLRLLDAIAPWLAARIMRRM